MGVAGQDHPVGPVAQRIDLESLGGGRPVFELEGDLVRVEGIDSRVEVAMLAQLVAFEVFPDDLLER